MPAASLSEICIEILSSENVSLQSIQAVGELIAADAAFTDRMADAHGRSGHSTAAKMLERLAAYEDVVEQMRVAWAVFNGAIVGDVFASETQRALTLVLTSLRERLDALANPELSLRHQLLAFFRQKNLRLETIAGVADLIAEDARFNLRVARTKESRQDVDLLAVAEAYDSVVAACVGALQDFASSPNEERLRASLLHAEEQIRSLHVDR